MYQVIQAPFPVDLEKSLCSIEGVPSWSAGHCWKS